MSDDAKRQEYSAWATYKAEHRALMGIDCPE